MIIGNQVFFDKSQLYITQAPKTDRSLSVLGAC
jgi:hypothetical protein